MRMDTRKKRNREDRKNKQKINKAKVEWLLIHNEKYVTLSLRYRKPTRESLATLDYHKEQEAKFGGLANGEDNISIHRGLDDLPAPPTPSSALSRYCTVLLFLYYCTYSRILRPTAKSYRVNIIWVGMLAFTLVFFCFIIFHHHVAEIFSLYSQPCFYDRSS